MSEQRFLISFLLLNWSQPYSESGIVYLKASGRSEDEIDAFIKNLSDSEKHLALLSHYYT